MLNPRHRSAREHLGELYLVLGEPNKAEEHLAALKEICLSHVPNWLTSNARLRLTRLQTRDRGFDADVI